MNPPRRPGLAGPIILIALGALALLSNVGLLPYGTGSFLWRLWPAALILLGLDQLVGPRGTRGRWLAFGLTAAFAAGVVWWAWLEAHNAPTPIGQTQRLIQSVRDAASARVKLDFGAGTLNVRALPNSVYLLEGEAVNAEGQTTQWTYAVEDGVGELAVEQSGLGFLPLLAPPPTNVGWNLRLSPSTPLDLAIRTGAGQVVVDLSGLTLTRLELDSGAGQTKIVFPAEGKIEATLRCGAGDLLVVIPSALPARVRLHPGFGPVSLDPRFTRQGDAYETEGFSREDDYVEMELKAGAGAVSIK